MKEDDTPGVKMNENLMLILLIAAGGAVGAVLRFSVALVLPASEGIAWNTLLVNFVGCSLITLIFFSVDLDPMMRAFLFIGIFGAFTTMSSLSLETMNLYVSGNTWSAVVNFMLNVTACIGGGALGRVISVLFF